MGEFGFSEMVLIVIVAIMIYGKDLPQAARKLAQMYTKLRRQLTDIKDEIQRQIPVDELRNELNKVESGLDPMAPQIEIPMAPTSVMAQVSGEAAALVTWNSVPSATTYTLKRSTSSSDPLLIVAMSLVDLSHVDSGLEPGKTYHYVVTAQNSAGESGSSEEAVVTIPAEAGSLPAPAPETAAAPPPAETAAKAEGNGTALEAAAKVPEAAAPPADGNGSTPEPATKVEDPPAA